MGCLVHLMQAEWRYGKAEDGTEQDFVRWPNYDTVYDIVLQCSKCGMTYEQLRIKAADVFRQLREKRINFNVDDNETSIN